MASPRPTPLTQPTRLCVGGARALQSEAVLVWSRQGLEHFRFHRSGGGDTLALPCASELLRPAENAAHVPGLPFVQAHRFPQQDHCRAHEVDPWRCECLHHQYARVIRIRAPSPNVHTASEASKCSHSFYSPPDAALQPLLLPPLAISCPAPSPFPLSCPLPPPHTCPPHIASPGCAAPSPGSRSPPSLLVWRVVGGAVQCRMDLSPPCRWCRPPPVPVPVHTPP